MFIWDIFSLHMRSPQNFSPPPSFVSVCGFEVEQRAGARPALSF